MPKILRWIVLPPLALVAIALAVANRHIVTLSFDPFDPTKPALGVDLPLAAIIFVALALGILIGGVSAWGQSKRKGRRRDAAFSKLTNLPATRLDS